jgi:PadR family transcriptional regulator PadR
LENYNQENNSVRLTALDQNILTALGEHELYGLELLECLNIDENLPLYFGSLYPLLNRLIKKKCISWRWGNEQEVTKGARRKYYKATEVGKLSLSILENYRKQLKHNSNIYKL